MAESDRVRVAICSNSLGRFAAAHDILCKLEAAWAHGFDGVEIAIECLEAHAASHLFQDMGQVPINYVSPQKTSSTKLNLFH